MSKVGATRNQLLEQLRSIQDRLDKLDLDEAGSGQCDARFGQVDATRDRTVHESQKVRAAMRSVTEATSHTTGADFFTALVQGLADTLGFKYVLLAVVESAEATQAETLALWANGERADNIHYSLLGTPCSNVLQQTTCLYSDDVQQSFPDDELLVAMEARSYLGTPLTSSSGEVLGLLAAIDDQPMNDHEAVVEVLQLFATQAATEIERMSAETALRESEQTLSAIFHSTFQLIGLLSTDGTLLKANNTALAFGNVTSEDVLNKPFWEAEWWSGDDQRVSQLRTAIQRAAQGEFVRYTVDVQGAKSVETVDFSIKPVFDDKGDVRLLVPEGRVITEQKSAEEALASSERRFRRLIQHAPDAIVLLEAGSGQFLMANPAAERLFKFTAAELSKRTTNDVSPIDQPGGQHSGLAMAQNLREACGGPTPVFEWTFQDSADRVIPCEVRLLSLELEGRTVIRGSITDITERKRVENAVSHVAQGVGAESGDAFFELLARCLCDAFDMEGAVIAQIEQDNPDVIETLAVVVDGQVKPQRRHALKDTPCSKVIEGRTPYYCDKLQEHYAEGACILDAKYTNYAGAPLIGPDGETVGLIAVLGTRPFGNRQLTDSLLRVISVRATNEIERRSAQAELEQTQAILGAAVEASPAGIIIADAPDGRIRAVNSAALGIRDAPANELTDIPIELHPSRWQCTHPDGTPFQPQDLPLSRAVLEGAVSKNVDVIIERSDGEKQWVLGNAAPVRDPDGTVMAGVVVFPDVTEQKRAEETLRKVESELAHVDRVSTISEMVGGLAHELNQPLYAIQNYARACGNLLDVEGEPDLEQLRKWLAQIGSTTEFAGQVISRLRDFVSKVPLKKKVVELRDIIDTAMELTKHDAQLSGVRFNLELSDDLAPVYADAVQIKQVLVNLLRNAFEAVKQEESPVPEVTITARNRRGYVDIAVMDNGPGFPSDDDSVFDAFHSTKPKGMGLGLAIGKSIIEAHGSTLSATNGPDGAVLRFSLQQG